MNTKRVVIEDVKHPRDEELLEAAEILRAGGLVAFPTETVYGLGGNGLDPQAAARILAHISSAEMTSLPDIWPQRLGQI